MIISKRLGYSFFRVPRTGSTTAEAMLRLCGVFNTQDILSPMSSLGLPSSNMEGLVDRPFAQGSALGHMTPHGAIAANLITLKELSRMKCFAFVRDPIQRYVSAYMYSRRDLANVKDFRNQVAQGKFLSVLHETQIDFFSLTGEAVLRPLPFDRFEELLRAMIEMLGGFVGSEIPRFKESPYSLHKKIPTSDWVDDETRLLLTRQFSEDAKLYLQAQHNISKLGNTSGVGRLEQIEPYG